MRLSDAILLGDVLRRRTTLLYLADDSFMGGNPGDFCGCALGGACLAIGERRGNEFYRHWPWTRERTSNECDWAGYIQFWKSRDDKPHGFGAAPGGFGVAPDDYPGGFVDVCDGIITIEQLAAWVRSVEPECGECNQFTCTCAHVAAPAEVEALVAQ